MESSDTVEPNSVVFEVVSEPRIELQPKKKIKKKVKFKPLTQILRSDVNDAIEVDESVSSVGKQKPKRVISLRRKPKKQQKSHNIEEVEDAVEWESDDHLENNPVRASAAIKSGVFSDDEPNATRNRHNSIDLTNVSFKEEIEFAPTNSNSDTNEPPKKSNQVVSNVQSVAIKFHANMVSPGVSPGDIVSIDKTDGSLVKGIPAPQILTKSVTHSFPPKMLPLRTAAGILGVNKGLLNSIALMRLGDHQSLYCWLFSQQSSEERIVGHVVLLDFDKLEFASQLHTINLGSVVVSPSLISLSDTMFIVYFNCPRESKNKVEVISINKDLSMTTAFGPAKLAGDGFGGCKGVVIDSNRALFTRVREWPSMRVEAIPADISKLPVVVMGSPVCVFGDGSNCTMSSNSYGLALNADGNSCDIIAPIRVGSGGYHISLASGHVTLPGPEFTVGAIRTCASGSIIPKSVPPVCSISAHSATMVYNDIVGIVAEQCQTAAITLLSKKHASSNDIFVILESKAVMHMNRERRKGYTHIFDSEIAQEHTWPASCIAPEGIPAFSVTEDANGTVWVVLPNGDCFATPNDTNDAEKAEILPDSLVPIGIVDSVDESGDYLIVVHAGLYDTSHHPLISRALTPGMSYYAYPDGTWGADNTPDATLLGIAVTSMDLLICLHHMHAK